VGGIFLENENFFRSGGNVTTRLKINREMARRPRVTFEECMEVGMSPAQREVFLVVDEFWKKWGCSPTLRQIADLRGKSGVGNTKEIVDRLVKLGVLKRLERRRSVRPVYINFRNVE
jgi:SOS-response transcriptional repressor LexA